MEEAKTTSIFCAFNRAKVNVKNINNGSLHTVCIYKMTNFVAKKIDNTFSVLFFFSAQIVPNSKT